MMRQHSDLAAVKALLSQRALVAALARATAAHSAARTSPAGAEYGVLLSSVIAESRLSRAHYLCVCQRQPRVASYKSVNSVSYLRA